MCKLRRITQEANEQEKEKEEEAEEKEEKENEERGEEKGHSFHCRCAAVVYKPGENCKE